MRRSATASDEHVAKASAGGYDSWQETVEGTLALIVTARSVSPETSFEGSPRLTLRTPRHARSRGGQWTAESIAS